MRKKRKLRARAAEAAEIAQDHALEEVVEALAAEALDADVIDAKGEAGVAGDDTDDVEVRDGSAADEDGSDETVSAAGDELGDDLEASEGDDGEASDGEASDGESSGEEGALHARDMPDDEFQCLVESLLFAADKPIQVTRIRQLTGERNLARIETALTAIAEFYAPRGMVLHGVSGAYQFRTHPRFSAWVQQLIAGRPVRLSRAQLETLAIIAYRQPITRPEIDDIRGVDSGGTLKVLLDRTLIRILGKKEEPGRPLLYGTTKEFLEFFNLNDLRDLPTLREYHELSEDSMKIVEKAGHDAPAGAGTIDELVAAANSARAANEQQELADAAAAQAAAATAAQAELDAAAEASGGNDATAEETEASAGDAAGPDSDDLEASDDDSDSDSDELAASGEDDSDSDSDSDSEELAASGEDESDSEQVEAAGDEAGTEVPPEFFDSGAEESGAELDGETN